MQLGSRRPVVYGEPSVFPGSPILDNFNRANEGPPPSANWSGPFDRPSNLGVASNVCAVVTGTSGGDYWSASQFGPQCECFVSTVNAGPSGFGIGVRITSPSLLSSSGYLLEGSVTSQGIYREDSGTLTQLGASMTIAGSNGTKIGLRAWGSTLRFYADTGSGWTLVDSRTDSTYGAAGYVGLLALFSTVTLDDFGGGTI